MEYSGCGAGSAQCWVDSVYMFCVYVGFRKDSTHFLRVDAPTGSLSTEAFCRISLIFFGGIFLGFTQNGDVCTLDASVA